MTDKEFSKLIDKVITAIFAEENYISGESFRRKMGLSPALFYRLKKEGAFEAGIDPCTRGLKRPKYHRFFNYRSGYIEAPGLPRSSIEQPKHRRNKNGKKAANPQSSPKQESRQGFQEGSGENAT